ncbi:hypothetical protein [Actinomadura macrotermitis]|uniref:Tissue inhibitor of metalloproteinase n=1 Tax=Actinomadura macrotermitis TaxID=2585200 RepID=A0A7K0C658_9ACTN|nr:hypothetical protein [Actinomadura macrotermitis]MQY08951.1 hypothetical protein [Actinomadura macrotermitis]
MPLSVLARTLLASALVVLLVVAAAPGRACACSCAAVPEQKAYAMADAVFTGRVVQRHVYSPVWGESSSSDPTVLVFEVSAVNKGEVSRLQDVRTAAQDATCGLSARQGDEYLIFADRKDGVLEAYACGGSRPAGRPLAVPSAPTHRPAPGHAAVGPAPFPRNVVDGGSVTTDMATAGGLAAVIATALLLVRHRRRKRT